MYLNLRDRPCVYIVTKNGEIEATLVDIRTALNWIDKKYGKCVDFSGELSTKMTFKFDKKLVIILSCHMVISDGEF